VALALQLLMGANDGGTLLGSIVATNIIRPVWAVVLLFIAIVVAPIAIETAVVTTLGIVLCLCLLSGVNCTPIVGQKAGYMKVDFYLVLVTTLS